MTTGLPQNLPPPQSPFVDAKTGVLSNDGYQFLMNFINQVAQSIQTATVSSAVAAAGATQATATTLDSQWNAVVSGIGGVLLQAYEAGQTQVVINETAFAINVYPPPGASIDGGLPNVPAPLNPGVIAQYRFFTASDIRTT